MIADFNEIEGFANECFDIANGAAATIQFSLNASRARYSKSAGEGRQEPYLIGNQPQFAELDTAFGMAAYSVILSVDLRRSSKRAVEVGAKHTYLTMHTYLPVMAELVTRASGKIVGLRGDGLFAAFGLTKLVGTGKEVTIEVAHAAMKNATRCGKGMLEATADIINPLLNRNGIRGDLAIGVGISVGEVVVTRIGLGDANEVTVYGPAVNQACKLCSKTTGVALTGSAWDTYPTSSGGKMKFDSIEGGGVRAVFPPGFVMLPREKPRWPR